MEYITNMFHSINDNSNSDNSKNDNGNSEKNKYSSKSYKPYVLEQGKLLEKKKYSKQEVLNTNNFERNNVVEGFGNMMATTNKTLDKNNSELAETMLLSNNFSNKINNYKDTYPAFIDETRNAIKLNDRTKNVNSGIKNNSSIYKNGENIFYDITVEKEGCYKAQGDYGLEFQPDMKDVNIDTCKMRASNLGYSGFALRKGNEGQLGCYLSKDISKAKVGDISTRTMSSFSFSKNSSANTGGLLPNGQIGIFTDTITNNLITDLPGVDGCNINGGDITINTDSIIATYGGNCKKEYLLATGTDTKLYYMPVDFSEVIWTQVSENNCCVTSMTQMLDGTLLGVGTDNWLYSKLNLSAVWSRVDNSCCVKSAIQLKDGTFLGVGMGNNLWTKTNLTDTWIEVQENSCCVTSIIQLNDSTLLGVGTDNWLYSKQNISAEWIQVPRSSAVMSVTQLKNGTFVGVGMENRLWTKENISAPWIKQGDGLCCVTNVTSITI